MFEWKRRTMAAFMALVAVVSLSGCSMLGFNSYKKQRVTAIAKSSFVGQDKSNFERVISWSPGNNIKLQLGKDNNIYISDAKGDRIIYRNYERDRELFENPYSLWSFDFFRIQWSADGRYAYIIDSIYDVSNDKLIPLKDCLVFSWSGNDGVYLSGGKIVEGKFWDNGFYGFYASKCIKVFKDGEIKTANELTDDKYFIVSEGVWDEYGKTLFRGKGSDLKVKTARFRFSEDEMDYKLIKAYQELREDEKVWELLNGDYNETASKKKALEAFGKLRSRYPIKLINDSFSENHLNWDFDMDYYLVDVSNEKIIG